MAFTMNVVRSQLSLMLCVFVIPCLSVAVCARQVTHLGIDLGPEYITASSFTIDRSPVPMMRIRGNKEYRAYLADTLENEGKRKHRYDGEYLVLENRTLVPAPPDTHDLQSATRIFTTALRDVKNAVATRTGRNLQFQTISLPRYFNDSSFSAVADAAAEVEPNFSAMQIVRFNHAAREGYNLTSCASFGLAAPECDIDEGPHYIIQIEYHASYLEIVMADVGDLTFLIEARARFMDLGEAAATTAVSKRSNTWLDWVPRLQRTIPANTTHQHYSTIETKFTEFLKDHEYSATGYNNLDELRAVTLSGSASPSAFDALGSAVSAALGHRRDRIRHEIEPWYVGAVGAGQRGRWQLRNPGFLDDFMGTMRVETPSYRERDEL